MLPQIDLGDKKYSWIPPYFFREVSQSWEVVSQAKSLVSGPNKT